MSQTDKLNFTAFTAKPSLRRGQRFNSGLLLIVILIVVVLATVPINLFDHTSLSPDSLMFAMLTLIAVAAVAGVAFIISHRLYKQRYEQALLQFVGINQFSQGQS